MTDFNQLMPGVAQTLLGEPNKEISTKNEWRFGAKGSLSVDLRAGRWFDHEAGEGGGVLDLVRRQTGRANGAAVQWLRDNVGADIGDGGQAQEKRRVVAEYVYQDANGEPYIRALKWSSGQRFSQQRREGHQWRSGTKGLTPVLYRLPELRSGRGHKTVLIPEGEKDVEALAELGFLATCNIGGAGKWRDRYSVELDGAHVVVLADNDQAGRNHAGQVARSIHPRAASVRVVHFPELPEKGDVSDWIARRRDAGEDDAALVTALRQRAREAPFWHPPAGQPEPSGTAGDWYSRTLAGARGQVLSNLANTLLAVAEDPAWRGVLAHDDFIQQAVLLRPAPVPGRPAGDPLAEPAPISDADVTSAQHWLQVAGLPSVDRGTVRDAMHHAALGTRRHPVRDYLRGLTWDGEPRIDTWLSDYIGADDTPYTRAVGRMWIISAVARVMRPGCKSDHLLVLEGAQGIGKSSACRALCGDAWFGDDLPSLDDQIRAAQYLRSKWIIEVAEMHSFGKAESAKLKSFITQQVEQFIPKYGRSEVREARQCVFIATTNKREYLRDETGGRRFWPVHVTDADVDALARDRDQIWAEAVCAYESGEEWWPSRDMERNLIQPQQEGRFEEDAWEPLVSEWLEEKAEKQQAAGYTPYVKIADVAIGALAFDKARIGRNDQLRISAVLERLGWKRKKRRGIKVWVKEP